MSEKITNDAAHLSTFVYITHMRACVSCKRQKAHKADIISKSEICKAANMIKSKTCKTADITWKVSKAANIL